MSYGLIPPTLPHPPFFILYPLKTKCGVSYHGIHVERVDIGARAGRVGIIVSLGVCVRADQGPLLQSTLDNTIHMYSVV